MACCSRGGQPSLTTSTAHSLQCWQSWGTAPVPRDREFLWSLEKGQGGPVLRAPGHCLSPAQRWQPPVLPSVPLNPEGHDGNVAPSAAYCPGGLSLPGTPSPAPPASTSVKLLGLRIKAGGSRKLVGGIWESFIDTSV